MYRGERKDKRYVSLILLLGLRLGELLDGPAFIATQAAIFAEEPAACGTASLQLPVKPVNGHFGPVTTVRRRKSAAMSHGQPAEEDRHVLDTLDIVAGIGMSDIGLTDETGSRLRAVLRQDRARNSADRKEQAQQADFPVCCVSLSHSTLDGRSGFRSWIRSSECADRLPVMMEIRSLSRFNNWQRNIRFVC